VIDHLYDHLEDDIRFDDFAEIACLSPHHWHRIYAAMRGETITATIRRLRLSRAAERLANSNIALETIAERAGYSSADAFGRAFKQAYGKSPADYRMTGSHAAFKAALLAENGSGFPISIETLAPIRCASSVHRGTHMQIDQAMGKLFTALSAQGLATSDLRMLAVFDLAPLK
jgi:AraC family transcriptional regulator